MKKIAFLLIGFAGFIFACQSNTEQEKNDTLALDTNVQAGTKQFCYAYIKGKDTATIQLMNSGTITTGELKYNLYEKDKNNGIIEGELHGDTLLAEYTFNSEGKESIRQVAFLKKGDQLLEGFGDVVEGKNGKMMFKDASKLTFGQSIVFTKVDCQ